MILMKMHLIMYQKENNTYNLFKKKKFSLEQALERNLYITISFLIRLKITKCYTKPTIIEITFPLHK